MKTKSRPMLAYSSWVERARTNVLAVLLAGWIAAVWADRAASAAVVAGAMTTIADNALNYKATGFINTGNAWAGGPVIDGPWFAVPPIVPPTPGGPNWDFSVRHTADSFTDVQATKPSLHLKGTHRKVPAPGHNEPANPLPEIATPNMIKVPRGVDKPFILKKGGVWNASNWGGWPHPGADPTHNDFYGITVTKATYSVRGAVATLGGGAVEILAFHDERDVEQPKHWQMGLTLASTGRQGWGSTVSFDANTGLLSLSPGRIDVLDLQGGLSGSVDPRYAHDAMLDAQFSVSPLRLQGIGEDGRYQFSGGEVNIVNEINQLSLQACFGEYVIGDTSRDVELDSFGVLKEGGTGEVLDYDTSSFLSDFAQDHVVQNLPTSNGFEARTIDLSFNTGPGMDLATLTNGFTTSAMFVPADIFIRGGGFHVDDHHQQPGDYNGDGRVDVRDYAVWREQVGSSHSAADGNGDGIVDGADYILYRKHFGEIAGGAGPVHAGSNAVAIPEPSIVVLAIIGFCLAIPACRTRSR
jgi:hypothetical protein